MLRLIPLRCQVNGLRCTSAAQQRTLREQRDRQRARCRCTGGAEASARTKPQPNRRRRKLLPPASAARTSQGHVYRRPSLRQRWKPSLKTSWSDPGLVPSPCPRLSLTRFSLLQSLDAYAQVCGVSKRAVVTTRILVGALNEHVAFETRLAQDAGRRRRRFFQYRQQ